MKFLALDFETSGLDQKRHAPVTLGVAYFDGNQFTYQREWTFKPPVYKDKVSREYDVLALQISGKTWKDINSGQPIAGVMAELKGDAIKHGFTDAMVVAFNAPFDFAWYSECLFLGGSWNQALRKFETFTPPLVGPWQCARLMAVAKNLGLDSYSLDAVAAHFGLSRSGEEHGALEDALLAGKVFLELAGVEVTA